MTKFLAGVLSVIAVGVLLIAYGLLNPPAAAFDARTAGYGVTRPMFASEQIMLRDNPYAPASDYGRPAALYQQPGYGYVPYAAAPPAPSQAEQEVRPVRTASAVSQRRVSRSAAERPRRNWKKTALVIGGSSAAGAGVGALFGGKKGALIGAAIGGGASTIYETTKR
ncbi:MAG: hypothetical protein GEU82_13540 [Luteitalea sp.]|nr:hypothetical protein [Luteitalea sp.]